MWSMARSGGTRVLFEVANRLVDRGHNVVFTSLGRDDDHKWFPLKAEVKYASLPLLLRGFRKYIIKKLYNQWDYNFELALTEAIPDCDINVATFCLTVYPTLCSGKGIMFYYVQHYEPFFFTDRYDRNKAKLSFFFPTKKLVVSKWLQQLIKRMTGQDSFHVSNGINTETFYPREVEGQTLEKTVISLFRGMQWKGEGILIEAMNILSKKIPDVKLLGVGNREGFEKILRNETIRFKFDFIDSPDDNELAKLYSSANVFAYASYTEGFPMLPLEAMACGTQVAATNCLGIREYAVNEYNALLTPIGDPHKLAEAIEKLLTDESLAEKLRKNGLETAKQYTWDKVVDKVENIFKSALVSS
jgi:glycosyltransferase involved in cell wall biosynthesis